MMYYLIVLIMTLCGAVASLFLKKASGAESLVSTLLNINLYIGGAIYLAAAVLNIYVLRYLDYSVVMPLTAFTYVWTLVLSYMVLKEHISAKKIVGVGMIAAGAILVSLGI